MGSHEAILAEMSGYVRAAGAGQPGDSVALLIRNAARTLRMEYGRVRRLWYGLAGVIPAQEADHLRAWHREHLARRADRLNAELAELLAEQDRMEAAHGVD